MGIFATYCKDFANGDEKVLLEATERVTPSDAMAAVNGLPKSQAQRTIKETQKQFAVPTPDFTEEDILKDLKQFDDRTRIVRDAVQGIRDKVCKHDVKEEMLR